MQIGAYRARPGSWNLSSVYDLFPIVARHKDRKSGSLSGGEGRYSSGGAWYLIALGALAIVMAIRFRQGIWGLITARTRLSLFPVGYQMTAGYVAAGSSGRDPAKEAAGAVAETGAAYAPRRTAAGVVPDCARSTRVRCS